MSAAELRLSGDLNCTDVGDSRIDAGEIVKLCDLAPPIPYHRPPPVWLDRQYLDPGMGPALDEILDQEGEHGAAIGLFEIQNGLVFGQGAIATESGRLIRDSAVEFLNHGKAPDGARFADGHIAVDIAKIQHLKGATLLVKRPWYRNFGHWLVDLLPIVPLVGRTEPGIDRIIYGDVAAGGMREAMEQIATRFYPKAEVVFAPDDQPFSCERLLYVQPLHVPPLFKHPVGPEITRSVALALGTPVQGPKRRLYVSRSGVSVRRLLNEDALIDVLSSYGFEVYYPEKHSFADQAQHFRNAEMVVGVKGAGLTSAMFCDAGSQVLVISPSRFIDPFFWDLLSPLGIGYAEVYCRAVSEGGPADHDFTAEIDKVRDYLDRFAS